MRSIILALILLLSNIAYGQAQTVRENLDLLLTEVSTMQEDTNKVWHYYDISYKYFQVAPDTGVIYGEKALQLSEELNFRRGIAYAHKAIARCHATQNDYPTALNHFQQSLSLAKELNDKDLEGAVLISLGAVYESKVELDKALEYFKAAQDIYEVIGDKKYLPHLYNNIGNVYDEKKQSQKALDFYLKGLDIESEQPGISKIEVTLLGNLGLIYTRFYDYENAFKYFFKALALQRLRGNASGIANNLNSIGATYRQIIRYPGNSLPDSLKNKKRNLQLSIKYLKEAIAIGEELGRKNKLKLMYMNISDSYEAAKDYANSLKYYQKYAATNDSLRNIVEERSFARLEAEYAVKKKTDSLKYANALKDEEITKSRTIRNGAVVLVVLICCLGIILVNRQNIKRKKLKAEKDLADNKLISATHRLNIFTKNLREKNQLIENFTTEIERLQALPCSNELPDTKDNLAKLQSAIILTDEQWNDFKEMFEQVHGNFLTRLKEKLPDLTPAETRFMALSKLKLSNKEMANMLGIGLSGMRNYKYRLRKKLDISDDSALEALIDSV